MAITNEQTCFILVHGSWHAGWCWNKVVSELNAERFRHLAIDLPGHGEHALIPDSYAALPLSQAQFSSEMSKLSHLNASDYANAVSDAAHAARLAGARRVIGVGHSMGGVPLTFAAGNYPHLFDGLIYVSALLPMPDRAAGVFLGLADQHENSLLGSILIGQPEQIGALRINPASPDDDYIDAAHKALAADMDIDEFATSFARLTPDAPIGIYGEIPAFSGDYGGIGVLPRRFIRCLNDRTLLPSTATAIVTAMDQCWPKRTTELVDLAAGHEPMFSQPQHLARAITAAMK